MTEDFKRSERAILHWGIAVVLPIPAAVLASSILDPSEMTIRFVFGALALWQVVVLVLMFRAWRLM